MRSTRLRRFLQRALPTQLPVPSHVHHHWRVATNRSLTTTTTPRPLSSYPLHPRHASNHSTTFLTRHLHSLLSARSSCSSLSSISARTLCTLTPRKPASFQKNVLAACSPVPGPTYLSGTANPGPTHAHASGTATHATGTVSRGFRSLSGRNSSLKNVSSFTHITASKTKPVYTMPKRTFMGPLMQRLLPILISVITRVAQRGVFLLPKLLPPLAAFMASRVLPALALVIGIFWVIAVANAIPLSTQLAVYGGLGVLILLGALISSFLTSLHLTNEVKVFNKVDAFFGTAVTHASDNTIVGDWDVGASEPTVLPPRSQQWALDAVAYEWRVIVGAENSVVPTRRLTGKVTATFAIQSVTDMRDLELQRVVFTPDTEKRADGGERVVFEAGTI